VGVGSIDWCCAVTVDRGVGTLLVLRTWGVFGSVMQFPVNIANDVVDASMRLLVRDIMRVRNCYWMAG
jgi:hypothetical protein